MYVTQQRLAILVTLVWTGCAAGCASEAGDASHTNDTVATTTDPLVGTWKWSGRAGAFVDLTITFNEDKTLAFSEHVTPASFPAGTIPTMPTTCVTTDLYAGTYAETSSQGGHALTWTFTNGTADAVTGCSDASSDSPGSPIPADAIDSLIGQGWIPPYTVSYSVTPTTLILSSSDTAHVGVGRGAGTTFAKVP
jgi:hypothetical protein